MKENQASKENRKEKNHKNGPILVEMNFTMQMKVGNCSLDQNPTLLWSAPKKFVITVLWKMAICVKVTYRPVAPPCAYSPSSNRSILFPGRKFQTDEQLAIAIIVKIIPNIITMVMFSDACILIMRFIYNVKIKNLF